MEKSNLKIKEPMYRKIVLSFIFTIMFSLLFMSCSKKNVTQYMTSREHFEYAMKFFSKKSYVKAADEFSLITYKFSGSDIADDAQYYLAECYFRQKDYVSASSEYDRLVSSFSRSEFVERAMYHLVICYNELSPGYALDQKFTYEAVEAVQNFVDLYPKSEKKSEVDSIYTTIKLKLAKKHFESANIYRKISEFEAAIVYYDQVIIDYYDSPFAGQARFWKGYCNFKIGEFQKATLILNKFISDYPHEKKLVTEAGNLLNKIKEKEEKEKNKKKT
ncbi:outer membrane protein assembly factor BamD [bacterium]|nr:outer membrane protein assembly factor BamD [bacterium]